MKYMAVLFSAGLTFAQAPPTLDVMTSPPMPGMAMQVKTFQFVSAESVVEGKTVTNAPYSGEGVTETTRVLADGTRIVNKSTVNVWRDGMGRTRREQTLSTIGPWAAGGEAPVIITIHDPVTQETIMLDTREKTARRFKGNSGTLAYATKAPMHSAAGVAGDFHEERHVSMMSSETKVRMAPGIPMAGGNAMYSRMPDGASEKVESLGKQTMEGVRVDGKRVTNTVAVGEIGNDRPIVSTREIWTAPDLQVTVMSKSTDPQFGETSYRLTNINRREPAPSIFQVPADYKVVDGAAGMVHVEERK